LKTAALQEAERLEDYRDYQVIASQLNTRVTTPDETRRNGERTDEKARKKQLSSDGYDIIGDLLPHYVEVKHKI